MLTTTTNDKDLNNTSKLYLNTTISKNKISLNSFAASNLDVGTLLQNKNNRNENKISLNDISLKYRFKQAKMDTETVVESHRSSKFESSSSSSSSPKLTSLSSIISAAKKSPPDINKKSSFVINIPQSMTVFNIKDISSKLKSFKEQSSNDASSNSANNVQIPPIICSSISQFSKTDQQSKPASPEQQNNNEICNLKETALNTACQQEYVSGKFFLSLNYEL
jgi:hypothetical protein